MKTVNELIDACGGDLALAYHLTRHQQTVKRWGRDGKIPRLYWGKVASIAGVPFDAVKAVHQKAKK